MKNKFSLNKILTVLMLFLAIFSISSCSRDSDSPQAPTDETKDRGHEMPDRVEFIFKNTTTSQEQRRTALLTKDGLKFDNTEAVEWKEGNSYLLEIVYYNNGRRLNSEFVSQEMAPIHQHFFQLNKNGKPIEETEMDKLVSYEYQDTDPENGVLGESGVSLRRRSWDTQNPTEVDPIGLKGVFTIKTTSLGTQSFDLRVRLAHFLVKNKLEPKTGRARKYNVLHYSGSFVLDTDMKVPVKIVQ